MLSQAPCAFGNVLCCPADLLVKGLAVDPALQLHEVRTCGDGGGLPSVGKRRGLQPVLRDGTFPTFLVKLRKKGLKKEDACPCLSCKALRGECPHLSEGVRPHRGDL